MKRRILLVAFIIFTLYKFWGYLLEDDLESYITYDVREGQEQIENCSTSNAYDEYKCVYDYIEEQKIKYPTDEQVLISFTLAKSQDTDGLSYRISVPYMYSKWTPWGDFDDLSSSIYTIRYTECEYGNEIYCDYGSVFDKSPRSESIELYEDSLSSYVYTTKQITIYDDNFLVFPFEDDNTQKYLQILTKDKNNQDEFWNAINEGIQKGEVLQDKSDEY